MSKQKNYTFWEDKRGNFVVWQAPNIWLWIWIVTVVASWFIHFPNLIQNIMGWVSLIALIIWAVLEMTSGVNGFRRLIGLLVLLLLVMVRVLAI